MYVKQNKRRSRRWQRIKAAALIALLVVGGLLTATAVNSETYSWLAWFSLLPLFLAIRVLRPIAAMAGGAICGICFYLFSTSGAQPIISPALQSLVLLAVVPALYAFFGTLVSRRVGFNPLLLALGWIIVELALKPLGLQQGLLASTQSASAVLYGISRMLGYVFVAFLVAGVNASLLAVLSRLNLKIARPRLLTGTSEPGTYNIQQTSFRPFLVSIFDGYPRAPPLSSRAST